MSLLSLTELTKQFTDSHFFKNSIYTVIFFTPAVSTPREVMFSLAAVFIKFLGYLQSCNISPYNLTITAFFLILKFITLKITT